MDGGLLRRAAGVAARLKAAGQTVAVAESSGGGLISAALLAQPGASAYFVGGAVVYTAQAREALLGIGLGDMRGLRSSSEPYARLLAERLRVKLGTDWALAETGAAGPSGNRYGDAAGHSCIAVAHEATESWTIETSDGDREANMLRFAIAALDRLAERLG